MAGGMAGWVEDTQGLIKIPTPGGAGGYGVARKTDINLGGYMNAHAEGPREISGWAIGLGETAKAAGAWAETFREQEEIKQRAEALEWSQGFQDRERAMLAQMREMKSRVGVEESIAFADQFYKDENPKLLEKARGSFQREFLNGFLVHSRDAGMNQAFNHRAQELERYQGEVWDGTVNGGLAWIDQNPGQAGTWVNQQMTIWDQLHPGSPPEFRAAERDRLMELAAKQDVSAHIVRGDYDGAEGVIKKAGLNSISTLALRQTVEHARSSRALNDKASAETDLQMHLNGLATSGRGVEGADALAARILKPEAYAEFKKEEAFNLDAYQVLNDPLRALRPRQEAYRELIDKYITPFEAGGGQLPTDADVRRMAEVRKFIREDIKKFQDDPIGSVDGAVKEILKTQYGEGPQPFVGRQHEIKLRHEVLAAQGVNPAQALVLTAAEAEGLAEQWQKAEPRQKAAMYRKWEQDYGEYLPRALAEAKIGAEPYFISILAAAGELGLAETVAAAGGKTMKDYKDSDFKWAASSKWDVIAIINNAVNKEGGLLAVQKGLYTARGDAGSAEQWESLRNVLTKSAWEMMLRGDNPMTAEAAVKKIAGALDAGYVSVADRDLGYVAIPQEFNAGAVMLGMNSIKKELGAGWDKSGAFFRNAGEDGVAVDTPGGQTMKMTFEELAAVGGGPVPADFGPGGVFVRAADREEKRAAAVREGNRAAAAERAAAFLDQLRRQGPEEESPLGELVAKTEARLEREAAARPKVQARSGETGGAGGAPDYQRLYAHPEYGEFSSPLDDLLITSGFGHREIDKGRKDHPGLDFRAAVGTKVMATKGGTVKSIKTGHNHGFGSQLIIEGDDGLTVSYNHLSGFAQGLKVGDKVPVGAVVAFSGNTGTSTAPHLHLEITKDGAYINPEKIFTGVKRKA